MVVIVVAEPPTTDVTTDTRPLSRLPPAAVLLLEVEARVEVASVVGVGVVERDVTDEAGVAEVATEVAAEVEVAEVPAPPTLTLAPTKAPEPVVGTAPTVAVKRVEEPTPRPRLTQRISVQVELEAAAAEVEEEEADKALDDVTAAEEDAAAEDAAEEACVADAAAEVAVEPPLRRPTLTPTSALDPVVGSAPAVTVPSPPRPTEAQRRSVHVELEVAVVTATDEDEALDVVAAADEATEDEAGEVAAAELADEPPLSSPILAPTSALDPVVGKTPAVTVPNGPRPKEAQRRSVHVVVAAAAAEVTELAEDAADVATEDETGTVAAVDAVEPPSSRPTLAPTSALDPVVGKTPAVTVPKDPRPRDAQTRSVHVVDAAAAVVAEAAEDTTAADDTGAVAAVEAVDPPFRRPTLAPMSALEPVVGRTPAVTVPNAPRPRDAQSRSVHVVDAAAAAVVAEAAMTDEAGVVVPAAAVVAVEPPFSRPTLAPMSAPVPEVGRTPAVTVPNAPRPRDTQRRSVHAVAVVAAVAAEEAAADEVIAADDAAEEPPRPRLAPTLARSPEVNAVGIIPALMLAIEDEATPTPRLTQRTSVQVAVTT